MKKKILFIDRDGTLITDPPPTFQVDAFPKLQFYPHVFEYLTKIVRELDYELIMVSNQDGLGTDAFPENTFLPVHEFIMMTFKNEGIHFSDVLIDRSFPHENKDTRKPGIGLLRNYMENDQYDLENSYVIGDRTTDVLLAKNLGCQAIYINNNETLGAEEVTESKDDMRKWIGLETTQWKDIYEYLKLPSRKVFHERNTNETRISIEIDIDGKGKADNNTGIAFFDHMLDQLARHGGFDLKITCKGDLHIDEHHTIEDVGIALGEAIGKALEDKRGIERYGFLLPMDDCLAQVAIDFGGRSWLVWEADFKREKIGEMPTEMFSHFFKSFSDAAKCNLNVKAEGENEHHKIESIFKAFAKAIKMAVKRDISNDALPSTKGVL